MTNRKKTPKRKATRAEELEKRGMIRGTSIDGTQEDFLKIEEVATLYGWGGRKPTVERILTLLFSRPDYLKLLKTWNEEFINLNQKT